MIVGLVASFRTSGGGRVLREHLASALLSSAHVERLVVFTPESGDGFPQPPAANGRLCFERVGGTGGWLRVGARHALAVPEAARRRRLDVLLCPGSRVVPAAGVPTLMWPLTVAPFDPLMRAIVTRRMGRQRRASISARLWLQARLIRASCKKADGLIFPTRYALGLYERCGAVGVSPSTVIPPAPGLPEGALAPNPYAFEDRVWRGQKFFLFVSDLYPYKMAVEMIVGFGTFSSEIDGPYHLVIAGAAPDRRYLQLIEETVTRERLEGKVHILGSVGPSGLAWLYRNTQCFIFPSLCEAGSFSLLDALALGRPLLSSSLSSMPEVCGDAALYFDPRDPDAIAERMLQVARDDALADDLARRSRERAAELPGWDDVARGVLSFAQRWC